MKRFFSRVLILITCVASVVACGKSGGNTNPPTPAHVHSRTLNEIITEQSGDTFSGLFHCDECGSDYYDTITYQDVNMPVINISGSLDGISKENKVTATLQYKDGNKSFDCTSTFKLQGASSIRHNYPKQNFSIQLFEDEAKTTKKKIEFVSGWGKQSKYVLKANYVDFSACRNIVSAKLYGDMVHSRNIQDEVSNLINGGAIDGYPVLLYHNGYFKGLYTLNIPKDKWCFAMGDGEQEAILMGDGYSATTELRAHVSDDFVTSKMDLEYCTNEDTDTSWVVTSFNNMIDFINDNDGENFRAGISNYINLERTMDSIIYTLIMSGSDNYKNNVIYLTYDGVHWQTSVYDMDSTWGMSWDGRFNITWNGSELTDPDWNETTDILQANMLFKRIYENYHNEFVARYNQLRSSVFTEQKITQKFRTFINSIPQVVYNADKAYYTEMPLPFDRDDEDINCNQINYNKISVFVHNRLANLDNMLSA